MAMVKLMRPTVGLSNPIINSKMPSQYQFRYNSDNSDTTPPSSCVPNEPTVYDTRKYGHQLPCENISPEFEVVRGMPKGIFRCTTGESLGLGASKGGYYQNPEYFSYHHMSFYDMHLHLRNYRTICPDLKRKPP